MCKFNISISDSPETFVARAKTEIEKAGGTLQGNDVNGTFQVKTPIGVVMGEYQMFDHEIAITVVKKPFLLSCNRIQKELNKVIH